jgi:hypothetical protein
MAKTMQSLTRRAAIAFALGAFATLDWCRRTVSNWFRVIPARPPPGSCVFGLRVSLRGHPPAGIECWIGRDAMSTGGKHAYP